MNNCPKKLARILQIGKVQVILLVLITILSYINIFQNSFVYDDEDFFVNWPAIQNRQHLPELIMGELPPLHQGVYRPLRSIVQVISRSVYQTNPLGYHIQSLLIHLAAVILVYLIIKQLTKQKFLPFGAALLFGVHPIHTEAVTYITASFDTLGIVLFLLSFLLYIKAKSYNSKTFHLYLISLLLITLAYFMYEMTLTFLPIIVLFDICFGYLKKSTLREKLKIYYLFLIPTISYPIIRFLIMQVGNRADYLGAIASVGAHQARIEFPIILAKYISLVLLPLNLTVTHLVPGNFVNLFTISIEKIDQSSTLLLTLAKIDSLFPMIVISSLCLISVKLFSKDKLLLFSILWLLITLIPVASILPQGAIIAERFLYLPSIGFFIFIICLSIRIYQRFKIRWTQITLILLFVLINLFYSYVTFIRNADWKNSISLWTSAIRATPDNPLPYAALGNSYAKKKQYAEAILYYQESLTIDPNNEKVHLELAKIYQLQGNIDLALQKFNIALKLNPQNPMIHNALAGLYNDLGEYNLAIEEYQKTIKLLPEFANAYFKLALVYEKQNNITQAVEFYRKTLTQDVTHTKAMNNLATLLSKNGQFNEAISLFEQIKKLDPQDATPYFNLGQIYYTQGKLNKTISEYKLGLLINPNETQIKEKLRKLVETK